MNSVHWPEPVIPVQSIAESGTNTVPDRYVKPLSERPLTHSSATEELNIPVIDLAGLKKGVTECRATIMAISDACKDWGFFQLVNHGISLDLLADMKTVWREFFDLPVEEKKMYANLPTTYEGYGSRLGVVKGAILDWGDYFFLHAYPESARNYSKWPSHCRDMTEKYGEEVMKLCGMMMKMLSISLGFDGAFLQKAVGGNGVHANMRVNYYPKCPQPDLTLGLSAHSDPGLLTMLLVDDHVKGLQVRKNGDWITVQPVTNAFIVNVADQLQVVSNGIYKSVEHRVITNAAEERLSIAFFYNPKSDLPLFPARELVTPDRPQLYQPLTFNEYRLYVRMEGPKGKTQIESLKAL